MKKPTGFFTFFFNHENICSPNSLIDIFTFCSGNNDFFFAILSFRKAEFTFIIDHETIEVVKIRIAKKYSVSAFFTYTLLSDCYFYFEIFIFINVHGLQCHHSQVPTKTIDIDNALGIY